MKKGDTWISAVLYIALGTIIVAMLLAAGIPVINKIRDRNIILETKDVMFGINNAVRTVIREGPGSQRSFTISIERGSLIISDAGDSINWTMESKTIFSEIGLPIRDGDILMTTRKTNSAGRYDVELSLRYNGLADLRLFGDSNIIGRKELTVKNNGADPGSGEIIVEIRSQ